MKKLFCIKGSLFFLGVMFGVLFFGSLKMVKAEVVSPGGEGYDDSYAIQSALDRDGKVVLEEGGKYYLYKTLILSSNMEIEANGATIVCEKPIAFNIPDRAEYGAAENIRISGGTWMSEGEGYYGSAFKFTHAKNLKFQNMKIRAANFKGHSLEFVACKDVVIENCDISGLGESLEKNKTEEAIQLDVADSYTAPFLTAIPFRMELAEELYNGEGCENVLIKKCKIVGNRGVVANYSKNGYQDTMHKNIKLVENKITGLQGEGVALFNTASATIKGNRIESKRKGSGDAYTVGLHFATFSGNRKIEKGKISIQKNTVYGGRQALLLHSHSGVKFGKAVIEKNKLFCKAGEKAALYAREVSIKKLTVKKNQAKSYKEK